MSGRIPTLLVGALLTAVRSSSPPTAQSLASKKPGCNRRSFSAGMSPTGGGSRGKGRSPQDIAWLGH